MSKTENAKTVTVGCKMPSGLVLKVYKFVDAYEPVMGGGSRKIKVGQQVGGDVVLKGFATEAGKHAPHAIIGGFGLTPGVDAEFWNLWLEQNRDLDLVKRGLVFAHGETASAEAEAKEKVKEKSGLEALDPGKLPVKGVATALESVQAA